MKGQLLAVDIGTSAARALVFDRKANLISQVRKPYPMLFPQPDWNEQDPDTITNAVIEALRESVMALPADGHLEGVVFCSQFYSILALSKDGIPLSNSLTWGDTRSADLAASLRKRFASNTLMARTGCPLQPLYPMSKIRWLKENLTLPDTVKFVSIKDYVLLRLTGQLLADWSTASASGLLDITRHEWDDEALSICQITPDHLPELASPRHIITQWLPDISKYIGLPSHTPLIIGAGDAPLANIGVGAITPDTLAVNVGTSAAARVLISKPQIDATGRLWTYVADVDKWIMGGIIGGGGTVYDWLLSKLLFSGQQQDYEEADRLSESVAPGADGLFFIPYFSGEQSPGWNPNAKGLLYGMTLQHEARHSIRAALEGITFALFRVARTIEEVRHTPAKKIYVTGGLTTSRVWLQIITHIFGASVVIPQSSESSARGAAILGWLALGQAKDYAEFHASEAEPVLSPDSELHAYYQQKYEAFCALNKRLQTFLTNEETGQ